ncbi:hypothetical protein ES702_02092 [subsurface metagenome]
MKHKKSNKQVTDPTNIQCQLCKRWFLTISRTHLYFRHNGITQAEYMEEYEVPTVASGLSRERMSVSSKRWTEKDKQLFRASARKMTVPELAHRFKLTQSGIESRLHVLGIKAKPKPRQTKWTQGSVMDKVKKYNRKGIPLNVGHMVHYDQPLVLAARNLFGSWQEALEVAGFDYSKVRKLQIWTKEKVIQGIKKLKDEGIPLTYLAMREANMSLLQAARTHFGSRAEAVRQAEVCRGKPY